MTTEYVVATAVGEVSVVEPVGAEPVHPAGADVPLQFLQTGLYPLAQRVSRVAAD
jgi:hypothetical protein